MAHSPSTLFHVAHRVLAELWPDAWSSSSTQWRGRRRPGGRRTLRPDEWTWFIVSSGVDTATRTPPVSVRTRDALPTRVPGGEVRAVSCQDATDQRLFQHRNLCGTKSVQNRSLLGQADICTSGTAEMSDRYLHVEQRFDPALDDPGNRRLIVEALEEVVPEGIQ